MLAVKMMDASIITEPAITDSLLLGTLLLGAVLWVIKFYVLVSNGYKLRVSPDEFAAIKFYREIISQTEDATAKAFHTIVLYGTYVCFITFFVSLAI